MVNGPDDVYVEREERIEKVPCPNAGNHEAPRDA
jgi:hypothetical protein